MSAPMHDFDPKLVVQIFQFLWTLYSSRRSGSKPTSHKPGDDQPAVAAQVPNPDKLKELIKDVEQRPGQTEETISDAIDKRFSPSEAQQVKDDFAAYAVLVNPPNFADYDFASVIQKYVKGMQAIALTADLFRLRGWKADSGIRLLTMTGSAAGLIPRVSVNSLVYPIGQIVSASVGEYGAVLTDEQAECPLLVVAEGVFTYPSYGMYGNERSERADRTYRFKRGQESNWIRFYLDKNSSGSYIPFRDFEYRLDASSAVGILATLKKDIVTYLRDLEEERPLLAELRRELDRVSSITAPKTQT